MRCKIGARLDEPCRVESVPPVRRKVVQDSRVRADKL